MNRSHQTVTSLDAVRSDIDTELTAYFDQHVQRALAIDSRYAALWRAMQRVVLRGGKRLRPYITIAAYQACGGKNYRQVLPLALAQELLHQGLLMHDDIIDDDYTRYGGNNVAGELRLVYSELADVDVATRHANNAALLGGDLLITRAQRLVASAHITPTPKVDLAELFAASIFEVAGGELLDTISPLYPPKTTDSIAVAHYKTASYSLIAPLTIGAAAAHADSRTIEILKDFGRHAGIAYQLVDDLLGIFGDEAITGKSNKSDLQEGKPTFLMQTALARAAPAQARTLKDVLGKQDISEDKLQLVRDIVISSGAKAQAKLTIAHHEQAALVALQQCDVTPSGRKALADIIGTALKRSK